MICLATAFMFNIMSSFTVYWVYSRKEFRYMAEAGSQLIWNIYFYFFCFVIISLSSWLSQSGKSSAVLCHKAINYSFNDSIINHVCYENSN